MEDLIERLVRWGLHPEQTVTDRFCLDDAAEAYRSPTLATGEKSR
jgi:hypothetical protein